MRARDGAERGVGPPRATEPGCGAEPHEIEAAFKLGVNYIMYALTH